MEIIDLIQGPNGGVFALSFGLGAASGYGFAIRTALAQARAELAKAENRVGALEEQNQNLTQRLIGKSDGK